MRIRSTVAVAGLAALCGLSAAAGAARAAPAARAATTLGVDASAAMGPVNQALVGVGWHPGGPPLAAVGELHPELVRVDAALEDLSPAPGEVHLEALLAHVADIRAVGAEPLVILSYMPAWLGGPNAYGRDPTRVPPADPVAWEELVHDVVAALATAPAPARRFEAWNEPDLPIFWQDTPVAWAEMVTQSARAVARVEAETGLDLAFGGPATAVPDPLYLAAFLQPLRDRALPLDFVSWHYYANTPFFGPDGNEFPAAEPVYPLLGRPNPIASPAAYGFQVGLMRELTSAALSGSGRPVPPLLIDEWNVSAGGFDRRHDNNEGAAFDAGVLIEMQQAGLDASAVFQAIDAAPPAGSDPGGYGGHGLVTRQGSFKPAWWTFWLWRQQAAERVGVSGADSTDGLWAVAARDPERVTILVSSFSAAKPTARTLDIQLAGLAWTPATATVRRIDGGHADARTAEPIALDGTHLRLELPAQAVALIEVRAAAAGTAPAGGNDSATVKASTAAQSRLPPTGGTAATVTALALLAVAMCARWLAAHAGRREAPTALPLVATARSVNVRCATVGIIASGTLGVLRRPRRREPTTPARDPHR